MSPADKREERRRDVIREKRRSPRERVCSVRRRVKRHAHWVLRNGAEGPFGTFQERILADTIQNVLLFKADVTYT